MAASSNISRLNSAYTSQDLYEKNSCPIADAVELSLIWCAVLVCGLSASNNKYSVATGGLVVDGCVDKLDSCVKLGRISISNQSNLLQIL